MNIAQISTEILKLKRDFRRKQKWSQKIPLFQCHSLYIYLDIVNTMMRRLEYFELPKLVEYW